MNRWLTALHGLTTALLIGAAWSGVAVAAEPPPLPFGVYGSVRLAGVTVADGTVVEALASGGVIATASTRTEDGESVYVIEVPGDRPDTAAVEGAVDGETIDFRIGGFPALAFVTWRAGGLLQLDLGATPTPTPPVVVGFSATTLEDTPLPLTLRGSDVNADPLTFAVVDAPINGTISGSGPALTYTPNRDFSGADSFTFRASDGTLTSNLATVSITVRSLRDGPRIDPVANQVLAEGETRTVTITTRHPEHFVTSLSVLRLPAFASFTDDGDGSGRLTLSPGFNDAGFYNGILIEAFDGLYRDRLFVSVRVTDVTGPPFARDQAVTVDEDTSVAIDLVAVDPDGDAITFSVRSTPEHGDLGGAAPALVYTPDADYHGPDGFSFVASDTSGESAPATVSIVVEPVPDAPRLDLLADRVVDEGATLQFAVTASDADGDALVFDAAGLPAFGRIEDHGDGSATLNFSPGFDDAGVYAGIEIRVSDGALDDTAAFTLTVVDAVPLPVAGFTVGRAMNVAQLEDGAAVASVSSVFSSSASARPENAIDRIASSRWFGAGGLTTNQSIVVTLAGTRAHVVERVVLLGISHPDGLRDFELRVSVTGTDAGDFQTVLAGRVASDDEPHAFEFAPTAARHVQLLVRDNWGGSRIAVAGFQIHTRVREGGIVSLLEGGAVVDSFSSAVAASAARAIDFDPGSQWTTTAPANQWIKIRLQGDTVHTVDRIRIAGSGFSDSPRRFEVRVSTGTADDGDFATVLAATLPQDRFAHWFTFPPAAARLVQLFVLDNHGNATRLQVNDFQVYAFGLGGADVPFDDTSSHPRGEVVAWQWDFGDGAESSARHPRHRYAAPGTYAVRLTVTDAAGHTASRVADYQVLAAPTATFDVTPAPVLEGQRTTFTDTSTDADGAVLGRSWVFGDTGAQVTGAVASRTFTDNGEFEVTLTVVDDQLLSDSRNIVIDVENLPPTIDAGGDAEVPWGEDWIAVDAVADDPSLVDRGTLVCEVEFGDGRVERVEGCRTLRGLPHRYAAPGLYTLRVTVTDKDGASATDTAVVNAGLRTTLLSIFGALNTGATGDVEARARLVYKRTREPLADLPVTFTLGTQIVTAHTDASGVARAVLTVLEGETASVRAVFAGDELYGADRDQPYAAGEIVAAIGKFGTARGATGRVRRFDPEGNFIKELDTIADTAENTGMCFDAEGSLYVTNFVIDINDGGSITKYDNRTGEVVHPWGGYPRFGKFPESCVVDKTGHIYTGEVDGDQLIRRHDRDGKQLAVFAPEVEDRGVDSINLAADQCTMFYTSEDVSVKRFDVCADVQLPDFATGLTRPCFALRLRANGEVLVACRPRVYRLSPAGDVLRTYTVPLAPGQGANDFFAMNLDPDGRTFWTGQRNNGRVHRVDIETGNIVHAFQAFTGEPSITELGGLAVFMEPVAAMADETPVADAGGPYTAEEGATLSFDGSASFDADGDPLTFQWLLDGQVLAGERPSLEVPDDLVGTVQLTVTDPGGNSDVDSAEVTVHNVAPSVSMAAAHDAVEGDIVSIEADFDNPGGLDTHTAVVTWGDGSPPLPASVDQAAGRVAAAHEFLDDGRFEASIVVRDDDGGEARATTIINVANAPPRVTIGAVPAAIPGEPVTLAGSLDDPGRADTHTFEWSFGDGESATGDLTVEHVYRSPGTYTVVLTVRDDDGGIGAAEVVVTVSSVNLAPVADAGVDQPDAVLGGAITLDGTASADPDAGPDALVYAWRLLSVPAASALTDADLSAAASATPGFTPDAPGEYVLELRVDDGAASDVDTVTVTVTQRTCDLDSDGDVDLDDVNLILAARNTPASGPGDARDVDGDGTITVNDARRCVVECDLPRCEIVGP